MSSWDNQLLLRDVLEAGSKIFKYTSGLSFITFIEDDKIKDAVVRNFEIIGEAANRLDPDFKDSNPHIEWRKIRGFRNRVVHDYMGVDYEIVWQIIQDDLEGLFFKYAKSLIQPANEWIVSNLNHPHMIEHGPVHLHIHIDIPRVKLQNELIAAPFQFDHIAVGITPIWPFVCTTLRENKYSPIFIIDI